MVFSKSKTVILFLDRYDEATFHLWLQIASKTYQDFDVTVPKTREIFSLQLSTQKPLAPLYNVITSARALALASPQSTLSPSLYIPTDTYQREFVSALKAKYVLRRRPPLGSCSSLCARIEALPHYVSRAAHRLLLVNFADWLLFNGTHWRQWNVVGWRLSNGINWRWWKGIGWRC
ncbi:hypothetical protein EVAR_98118_1 [Eumeta japonica]|uniref:Uncharacterized protein n=1 Tax=Eumeta variegata TaxID=151549 RepID=A0A4C2A3I6_EUMVA|nr:hypothetical protein EVAR_98118_1 [Eumeta japonica]